MRVYVFHSLHIELFYKKSKVFQVKYDLFLWVRPHTIQTLQSPYQKGMLLSSANLSRIEVSLTHATQNGFGYLSILRFSFSTSYSETMFKLLPSSMIMVHNLPWQEIRVWKMLVCRQSSSPFTFGTANKDHTTRLCPCIMPS